MKFKIMILDNIVDNSSVLLNAKTIFLNGTCGKYEEEDFNKGTKKLLQMLGKCEGNVYAGGGDTAASINKFDSAENFTFISSGGGATLEYVAYQKLPALEYIKENNK